MSRYREIIAKFTDCPILLVGDIILDHYAFGRVNRVSPEAPIQILDITREEYRLGGAVNVANNLISLKSHVAVSGVIGEDQNGQVTKNLLTDLGADIGGVFCEHQRPTTVKTRMIAQGHHLLRADREIKTPIQEETAKKIELFCSEKLESCQALVLSDYAKGVLSPSLCSHLIQIAKQKNKSVYVGPKGTNWEHYKGSTLLSANRKETEAVVGFSLENRELLIRAGEQLLKSLDLEIMVITLGGGGIYVANRCGENFQVNADAREVFDVTGAGDTVLSLLSLGSAVGGAMKQVTQLANTAAGIVVGKVGASTVTQDNLCNKLLPGEITHVHKVISLSDLTLKLEDEKQKGRVIVFTNGCFDVLHPGHVRYLEHCKNLGDILVVGLNSNHSVTSLKGPERPVLDEKDRAEMLAALSSVDYVVIFNEETPGNLIKTILPDILVKGSDWSDKKISGREVVESHGGRIEFYPFQEGYSTTNVIKKILQQHQEKENS